jgi:WD40 repeat protein
MIGETIYTVGGTVQAGQGVYIERAADAELLELCRQGAFAYVLTARQMGKSSLMTETARRLNEAGIRTVLIDLTLIGTALSAEQWYQGLLLEIADQLDLPTDALQWWGQRAHMGPAQRLTAFLREVVLREVAAPVVIFVDEIDTTLSLDFTDDFYAAIRALYNARAQQPELSRLSFVLIGVAIPGDLIKDPQRTPFNIGRQIELSDFGPAEAAPFAYGLNLPAEQSGDVLSRVLLWTRGHPYLTQRLCAALAAQAPDQRTATGVDKIVKELFLGEQSKQDNNLQFVRDMLTRRAPDPIGVLTTYLDILRKLSVRDDETSLPKAHLKLTGVVRRRGTILEPRNGIYLRAFGERWVKENLPRDYLSRRLQRIGLVAIGVLAALSLLLGVFLFGSRSREAELQAQKDTAVAAQKTSEANRNAAISVNQTSQANEKSLRTAVAEANLARATAASASNAAEEADRATSRQFMISDAQAALVAGNLDQARLSAIVALRADPELLQASSVLVQAAFAPGTRRLLEGHTNHVLAVAWSPDGQQVVSASADNTLSIWEVANGQAVRTLQGHTAAVTAVAFSPDGTQLVSASQDGTVRLWDVASGATLYTLQGHTDAVNAVAFSPDGGQLASASSDNTLRIWDVTSWQTVRTLEGHMDAVNAVAFSPDGGQLASASRDTTLWIWDVASGATLYTLQGHTDAVTAVAFSPDGTQLASASRDDTLRIWDVSSSQSLHTLRGHTGAVTAAAWSPDGTQLVSASQDGTLRLWDVASGATLYTLQGHTDAVTAVAFSPDGKRIVSASSDDTLRIWDVVSDESLQTLKGHTGLVTAVAFSPDGTQLTSVSRDGNPPFAWSRDKTLRIWDVASGKAVHTLQGHTGWLTAVAWSPDGKQLVSASNDETLRIWDVASGETVRTLAGHTGDVGGAAWSPDGKQIISASSDNTLRIWDVASGKTLRTLEGHTDAVTAVAWSPGGKQVVSASSDNTLRIWDVASGTSLYTLQGHSDGVIGVAWSPDGKQIVSASNDKTLRIWDVASGQSMRTLSGHIDEVWTVAWSPDGKQVVSGSRDKTLRIWDVASGRSLRTLEGHTNSVRGVAWSPDGAYIASGSYDRTVRVWPGSLASIIDWTYANRYVPELTAEQRLRYGSAIVGMDVTPTP